MEYIMRIGDCLVHFKIFKIVNQTNKINANLFKENFCNIGNKVSYSPSAQFVQVSTAVINSPFLGETHAKENKEMVG